MLRVLAFQPFDTGSHRAVRESIARHSRHRVRWVCRPGRAWKWRMRLGAFELLEEAERDGVLDEPFDAILGTSLLNLADLRAGLPRGRRDVPCAIYMHENQAAYPVGHVSHGKGERDVHFALSNLASVLTADRVIWNSVWNMRSFLDGLEVILAAAPDRSLRHARERIEERSVVVWPPVEAPPAAPRAVTAGRPLCIAWPHRWEHDKGPDELLRVARELSERLDLRWTILGQSFRTVPPALRTLRCELGSRIDHMGFEPDSARSLARLARCDWVLSTARHEFFGIAVAEALFAGCLPWLPPRLSYPEILPPEAHGLSPLDPPDAPDAVRRAVRAHLAPAQAARAVASIDDALEIR
jgi:glycosyltransferase involved in cell wall biosynthesis